MATEKQPIAKEILEMVLACYAKLSEQSQMLEALHEEIEELRSLTNSSAPRRAMPGRSTQKNDEVSTSSSDLADLLDD